jgi:alpha-galactosidase
MGLSTPSSASYGWNDSDMLEVGNPGLTDIESQTHFSLWAITASPLLAGNDLRLMTPATKKILVNTEVIAINQDHLGLQGFPTRIDGSVWAKPLNESGARAVVLVNQSAGSADVSFQLPEIGLRGGAAMVRDLIAQKDLGPIQDSYSVHLLPHASATLKVNGTEPPRPHGTAYLSDLTWTYAANGLGSVHKDESNTSSGPSGTPISLRGTSYTKGLGADAPSMIIYRLAQKCTSFSADIGVDDSARGQGSVVFQVWADGEKLFDTNTTVTGMSAVQKVTVPLDGKRRLKLLVTNAGDGNALDRADWANAQVVCAP